jgi:hypothetical protein
MTKKFGSVKAGTHFQEIHLRVDFYGYTKEDIKEGAEDPYHPGYSFPSVHETIDL